MLAEAGEAADGEEGEERDGMSGETRSGQTFNCGQCDFTYRTIKEFMVHVKTEPGHEPVCLECNSKFQNFDNLRHHLRKYHMKAREVVCRECGKVSRSEDQQYQHWNYVHKVEPDLFCNLCGQQCQNMFKLRQHTKKCLTKDPARTEKERLENEAVNRSREQVVTWSFREYREYRDKLESQKLTTKSGGAVQLRHADNKRRRVRQSRLASLSQDREDSEDEEENFVKKFKPEPGVDERDGDSPELDLDTLLEVKYEADSDMEETEAQAGDINLNNNQEDTADWSNGGKEADVEEEDGEEDDHESNLSDEESFHPTDLLEFQSEPVVRVEGDQSGVSSSSPVAVTDYRFQCSDCQETFRSLSTLKRHKREEHSAELDESQRNVGCPICSEKFFSQQTVRRHRRKHHPEYKGDPKYSCSECEEKFYKYPAFRDHMRQVHSLNEEEEEEKEEEDKKFKCPTCPESFFSESSLKRHRRKFHPETLKNAGRRRTPDKILSWPCNECDEVLRSQSTLKKHKKAEHQKKKKCNMCEEMVFNLPQHRLEVHPEIMAVTEGAMAANGVCICPYCSKQIATQQHLESHIKRMHEELLMKNTNDVMDSLYCVECGTHFDNARAVRLHRKATHDRHLYVKICPHCAKEVMNLQKHIRDAHPDPHSEKDWPCKDCEEVFRTTRDLRYHRAKVHEKEICPFCGKLATKEHIEYVHRVQPVQCDLCLAELKNKRALRNHKNKVHAPAEQLRCGDCGQMFDNKIKLYAHTYAVHSYQESRCEWCGGTYKNKKLLQAHKRVMHKDLYIGRDTQIYNPAGAADNYNAGDSNSNSNLSN